LIYVFFRNADIIYGYFSEHITYVFSGMLILFLGHVRYVFSASFLEPGYVFRTHFGLLSRLLFWNPVMFFGHISVCFLGIFFGTRLCFSGRVSVCFLGFFFGTRLCFSEHLYIFWNVCGARYVFEHDMFVLEHGYAFL